MTEFLQGLGMTFEWSLSFAAITKMLPIALPPMLGVAVLIYAAVIAETRALGENDLADYGALRKAMTGKPASLRIADPTEDSFLTKPIARASMVMQGCNAKMLRPEELKEAA